MDGDLFSLKHDIPRNLMHQARCARSCVELCCIAIGHTYSPIMTPHALYKRLKKIRHNRRILMFSLLLGPVTDFRRPIFQQAVFTYHRRITLGQIITCAFRTPIPTGHAVQYFI